MGFRLTNVPLTTRPEVVTPGGGGLAIRSYQPVVWVRLVPWGQEPGATAVPFPAVVDSGNNHYCLIPGPLARPWMGVDPAGVLRGRRVIVNGYSLPCYGLNLDVFRSPDGRPTDRVAARLQTGEGVLLIPDALVDRFPRMPVIGVRCLTLNRVTFTLNGDRQTYSLSQPSRPTPAPRASV